MTPSEPAPDRRRPRAAAPEPAARGGGQERRVMKRRRPDRRHDRAADRASGGAADPADQLAGRLLRGDDRRLHGRRADLQLPRRAARRAAGRARPEARADLHRAAAGLHDPGADLDLRRLHPRLPDHRLPALALRRARPLPPREAGVPAVPGRLAAPVPARLRLRLLRGDPARLRLLPELPAVRHRRADRRAGRRDPVSRHHQRVPGADDEVHDRLRPLLPAAGGADADGHGRARHRQGARRASASTRSS